MFNSKFEDYNMFGKLDAKPICKPKHPLYLRKGISHLTVVLYCKLNCCDDCKYRVKHMSCLGTRTTTLNATIITM